MIRHLAYGTLWSSARPQVLFHRERERGMTETSEELKIQETFAVFFDMCSSSTIMEDLILTNNLRAMRNLLIKIKKFLRDESGLHGFEVYKFIGDGWVLLFPADTDGEVLIGFLEKLSGFFAESFNKLIVPRLQITPEITGLKFGVDKGQLVRIIMLEKPEYIGRALNVASRLQGAIGDKDGKPQYKLLLTKHAYHALRLPVGFRKTRTVTRELRNIQGGQKHECVKIVLRVRA